MRDGTASSASPRERVEALLALARRLADPNDALGQDARRRLVEAGDLSPEGIELALTEHLETHATAESLRALVASARPCRQVAIVLSANVCTAAVRALALGLAGSDMIVVKPSRRDAVLAERLAGALPWARLVTTTDEALDALEPGDELHVYGSDATIDALERPAAARGARLRAHGTGFGVALVEDEDDLGLAADDLARDLVPFDGRGCLSPRLALVDGSPARARAFAAALHVALSLRGERVPRGPLGDAERSTLALHRRSLELVGEVFEGPHHLIGLDPAPLAASPAPAHRALTVYPATEGSAARLLAGLARYVTTLGAGSEGRLVRAVGPLVPAARRARLGEMQRPPLDGPVDRRERAPRSPVG